ncbi:sperm-tail PG-rich repeat protein (macronuclear) [Tetrahymena thermophila SB210]|uniref:Sperm-tail PG-rich repeat protein n=1 Tax=Tetrahymena thermophila (strain SB210) TaxID=312017 RepID=Q22ML6_TETTS|nr:sperm-tail PG-rich repeat protein [Tetrahymena thermophila SB210]EAR86354.2 sperm-tail PG-rich repeat protein [Tetrahymena thermophila SB210]|eukprot:XP_977004.2 sperm-tail PG-rich repeat protein [Tetrahymena thermophila SB210]
MNQNMSDNKRKHQDGFSFGMRGTKGVSCIDSAITFNPGVGQYEILKGFEAQSKSSSKTKFKLSERFKSQQMQTPGPGSYNPLQAFLSTKKEPQNCNKSTVCESNRSNRSLFQNSSKSNNLGPGYYYFSQMNDTFFNSTQNSIEKGSNSLDKTKNASESLNLSFSYRLKGVKFDKYSKRKLDLIDGKKQQYPPVGSYNIQTNKFQDSFTFPKEKRKTFDCIISESPGPCQYSIQNNFFSQTPQNASNSTLPTQRRFIRFDSVEDTTPGPGYYVQKGLSNYKFSTNSSYSFGKQKKEITHKNQNPSPSQYRILPFKPKNVTIIGDSQRPGVGNGVPGVGSYNITLSQMKKLYKQNNFTEDSEENNKNQSNLSQSKSTPQINYKERLLQQKKILLAQSPNFGSQLSKNIEIENISLGNLKKLNTPSPAYYSNLLQVVKKQPIQFAKGNRRYEFLDVYNVKLPDERSPGPLKYKININKSQVGGTQSQQKKGDLFKSNSNPGVGQYNINRSLFPNSNNMEYSIFSNKASKKKFNRLPKLQNDSNLIKSYLY